MNDTSVAVLGSTGSIGIQTLDVIRSLGMRITLLSAKTSVGALEKQIREFSPAAAVMTDPASAEELKIRVADTETKVYSGEDSLCACVSECGAQTVVNAVVGFAGLKPTVAAVEAGKRLALANKESLVAGGEYVIPLAKKRGVDIFPIDSEHSAIFQCMLASSDHDAEVDKIILTGSGGPFRGMKEFELRSVTPEQAVKHPNWNMGQKISVDSATLMNKGLEVIEAVRLFGVPTEKIEVVIHKESIIHSMVRFRDGAVIAQMSYPDMRLPISYALTYPSREYAEYTPVDFATLGSLSFEEPDVATFKCLDYAYTALEMGGNATAVLNGANEVAVDRFLKHEIGFCDIARCVETALLGASPTDNDLDGIIDADLQGRRIASVVKRTW